MSTQRELNDLTSQYYRQFEANRLVTVLTLIMWLMVAICLWQYHYASGADKYFTAGYTMGLVSMLFSYITTRNWIFWRKLRAYLHSSRVI